MEFSSRIGGKGLSVRGRVAGAMHGRAVHELPAFQRRLDRQAEATRPHRLPLYRRAGLASAARVLDVGCGPGGVTADLADVAAGSVVAVDVDRRMAARAHGSLPEVRVLQADGRRLPFPSGSFDAAVCNLVLLWFHIIKAVQNNRIFIVDEEIVSRPTMRLLWGISEIGNYLYPDLFKEIGTKQ